VVLVVVVGTVVVVVGGPVVVEDAAAVVTGAVLVAPARPPSGSQAARLNAMSATAGSHGRLRITSPYRDLGRARHRAGAPPDGCGSWREGVVAEGRSGTTRRAGDVAAAIPAAAG
jgi:hypothetical protein